MSIPQSIEKEKTPNQPRFKKPAFWTGYFLPKMQSTIATFRYLFLFIFGTSASLANISFSAKLILIIIAFSLSYIFYKNDQSYLKNKQKLLMQQKASWQYNTVINTNDRQYLQHLKSNILSQHGIEKFIFLTVNLLFQYLVFFDITYIASVELGFYLQQSNLILISALLSLTCTILDKKSIIDQQQKLNYKLLQNIYEYFNHDKNKNYQVSSISLLNNNLVNNMIMKFIGPICIIALYTMIQYFLFSEKIQQLILFYASSSSLLCLMAVGALIYQTWNNPTWYNIAISAIYALTTSISFTLVGSTLLHDIFHYADSILNMPARFNSLLVCSNILGVSYGVANYNMHSRELLIKRLAETIVAKETENLDNIASTQQQVPKQ